MSTLTHLAARTRKTNYLTFLGGLLLISGIEAAHANDDASEENGFFESIDLRAFGDARLRYHTVNEEALPQGARGLSLSVKAGLEFSLFENSTFLIELEGTENFIEDFNDTLNGQTTRPVISDPENFELNRLQFQTEFIPNTRLTLGRQSIALDDWRFIGHWPFRQNEQTFDAVRVESKIGSGLLNAAYVGKVQRQFGNDSPIGEFDGDSALLNYSFPTPIGRFAAFYYGLDLETGEGLIPDSSLSSATTGVRVNGRHKWGQWGLSWDGSIAQQTDFADNPNDFNALYASGKFRFEYDDLELGVKGELLGSDNGQAVQTPLGALHRLQGFADVFSTTPDDGLRDVSVSASYNLRNIGIFEDVRSEVRYHWFDSDAFDQRFGTEFDVGVSGKYRNVRFGLEYADYDADTFSSDTRVFILSAEFNFD